MFLIYYSVVLYLVLQRIAELQLSRRNQRLMLQRKFVRSAEGWEYIAMVAIHVGWFIGLLLEPLLMLREPDTVLAAISFGVFFFAQSLRIWAIRSLRGSWNVNIFVSRENDDIVRTGPYRFIRHPNYLAVILEIAFVPIIGGAYLTAAIGSALNASILSRRIPREEAELFKNAAYRESFRDKGRLLPYLLG